MTTDTHRVMPHENGWQVKRVGTKRASHVTETKAEAEKLARKISANQATELVIQGADGTIQSRDSHGNDPRGRG